jgi:ABC-type transport system involved in cytochrome c biogenesis permease subunit
VVWFTDRHFFLLAVAIYGLSTVYSVFLWRMGFRKDDRVNYLLLLAAFALHTVAMFYRGLRFGHCPVNNLYEATTFIAWTIVAAYLVIGLLPRLRFLGAFASPVLFAIGVFALMPALDLPHELKPQFSSVLTSLHATLILLAYGAFGLSAVAALMFLTEEHDLKFHKLRAFFSLLPPIQRLERVMNGLVIGGLFLLATGLAIGLKLIEIKQKNGAYAPFNFKNDPFYFYREPLVTYLIFIWVFYFGLLMARWRFGQGGRRFAWGMVASFVFILLTFWGFLLLSPVHQP